MYQRIICNQPFRYINVRHFAGKVRMNRVQARDKKVVFDKSRKHRLVMEDQKLSKDLRLQKLFNESVDSFETSQQPLDEKALRKSADSLNLFKANPEGLNPRIVEHRKHVLKAPLPTATSPFGSKKSLRQIRIQNAIINELSQVTSSGSLTTLELDLDRITNGVPFAAIEFTRCDISPDLKNARVFWLPPAVVKPVPDLIENVAAIIEKHRGVFRKHVTNALRIRVSPVLEFKYDKVEDIEAAVDDELRRYFSEENVTAAPKNIE